MLTAVQLSYFCHIANPKRTSEKLISWLERALFSTLKAVQLSYFRHITPSQGIYYYSRQALDCHYSQTVSISAPSEFRRLAISS